MGGIGLAIAGRLRAEINLAAQNGLYLLLMLMSGMVFPLTELPLVMRGVSRALPSTALADLVREGLSNAGTRPGFSLIVLAAWAVVAPVVAAISFRWD
jgi:ABC-2 type transport system permease protein